MSTLSSLRHAGRAGRWIGVIAALTLMLAPPAAAQQVRKGLVDFETFQRSTPMQKDQLEACLRVEVPQCTQPTCAAGTRADVEACMRPLGMCVYTKARACTVQHLGEASLRK